MVQYLTKNPEILANRLRDVLGDKVDGSASIFALWGNDNFKSVTDYEGKFQSASISIMHGKGFMSWSDSCRAVSLTGLSISKFTVSYSETNYIHVAGEEKIIEFLSDIGEIVLGEGRKLTFE